ncbi:O-antigen ligase family protein [Microbacterium sp. zg.Y909]|nr:O-antigen ligase family protein [Microbacterium sp. zg.Y909]
MPVLVRSTFILASIASLFGGGSRAGLASGLVLLLIALLLARPRGSRLSPTVVGVALLGTAGALPLAATVLMDPPEWMRALTRILGDNTAEQSTARNTWDARIYAWTRIVEYTAADQGRFLFGSGAGSHPIRDSGALIYLSGDPSVRAAHNFVITWFAMFGLIGVLSVVLVLVVWALVATGQARQQRGLNAVGLALFVSLLVAGLAGVIVESPFGYMPLILGMCCALLPTHSSVHTPFTTGVRGTAFIGSGGRDGNLP